MKYIVLMLSTIIMLSLTNIGFSQSAVNSTAGDKEVKLGSPILQKVSDKGIYLVSIKSGQSALSTGLNLDIVFLNKTSPQLNTPPPNAESNLSSTEYKKSSGLVVPSVVERTLPVKSYDIVINSSDGKEIWNKTNQQPQAGHGPQTIVLKDYDIGNVTISIKNIVADPALVDILNKQSENSTDMQAGLNQPNSKPPNDSVKFKTSIIVI
ncbi:MAG: hypothetical protein E6L04_04125 [Thaumarchaeota archaeon]|nr:MAG: hypothetical protein E6L04_04125 [Nitrososphaerota archaeon]